MRRKSREVALQTLYSLTFEPVEDYLGMLGNADKIEMKLLEIADQEDIEVESPIYDFAQNLLDHTVRNIIAIDERIKEKSMNWSFERIATLDKSLLRIATYELMFTDTPIPIIIDEAVEISKKFCSEKTGNFINGILNAIAKESRIKK